MKVERRVILHPAPFTQIIKNSYHSIIYPNLSAGTREATTTYRYSTTTYREAATGCRNSTTTYREAATGSRSSSTTSREATTI
ncbi:MAG: hypothetical protein Q8909_14750 [Bacteroidota bacterium]|nr:hypothetical protein [Bacteroidota bacterium]